MDDNELLEEALKLPSYEADFDMDELFENLEKLLTKSEKSAREYWYAIMLLDSAQADILEDMTRKEYCSFTLKQALIATMKLSPETEEIMLQLTINPILPSITDRTNIINKVTKAFPELSGNNKYFLDSTKTLN